ncbi:MAG: ABC transporter substrate-binding protein, partial [Thermoflexibacteraceae bacterium]
PLLERSANNEWREYGHYFYAYAAFQRQEYAVAQVTLQELVSQYSQWEKIDDAYYLLAHSAFAANKLQDGVKYIQNIKKPALQQDAYNLEAQYVRSSNDLSTLKVLHTLYPKDENVAYRLYTLLASKKDLVGTEKETLTTLQTQLKLISSTTPNPANPTIQTVATPIPPANIDKIEVGLFLPMLLKEADASKQARKQQFVIDFYYGLLVAQEKLKEEGIDVNMYLYDTERDESKIKRMLNNPTLQNAHLLIGAMYPKDTYPLADFAQRNNICLVNPLTPNVEWVKNCTNCYLSEPSAESIGNKTAQYVHKTFSDTTIIYYGSQRQDSLLAYGFLNKYKELGGKVPILKNIGTLKNAFKVVSTDLSQYMGKATKASVLVATTDATTAVNILSGVQSQSLSLNIITTQEWLDFTQVTYAQLEQANVNFIMNNYIDYYLPAIRQFDAKYIDKSNILPSKFSYMGHDVLYYFAKMIKQYGKNLSEVAKTAPLKIDGLLLEGFDYRNGQDNQHLFIGKFKEGKLEILPMEK